jgi:hypothetical protein
MCGPFPERRISDMDSAIRLRWVATPPLRFTLIALGITLSSAPAQDLRYHMLPEHVLEHRMRMADPHNPVRFARLKQLFEESGCTGDRLREQKVGGSRQPNLICQMPGTAELPRRIIVGAHFDSVGSDGVIDNWSGAVIVSSLAEIVRRNPPRHTLEFVGFAGEESGLLGSHAYVRSIPKADRKQIAAVLILDSLGLTSTKCWVHGSTPGLVLAARKVATALKLDFQGVDVERVGSTDSEPFKDAKIPVLSLHSVTQETWQVINGPRDIWGALSWKDYYDSYRLIAALVAYLDEELP